MKSVASREEQARAGREFAPRALEAGSWEATDGSTWPTRDLAIQYDVKLAALKVRLGSTASPFAAGVVVTVILADFVQCFQITGGDRLADGFFFTTMEDAMDWAAGLRPVPKRILETGPGGSRDTEYWQTSDDRVWADRGQAISVEMKLMGVNSGPRSPVLWSPMAKPAPFRSRPVAEIRTAKIGSKRLVKLKPREA